MRSSSTRKLLDKGHVTKFEKKDNSVNTIRNNGIVKTLRNVQSGILPLRFAQCSAYDPATSWVRMYYFIYNTLKIGTFVFLCDEITFMSLKQLKSLPISQI